MRYVAIVAAIWIMAAVAAIAGEEDTAVVCSPMQQGFTWVIEWELAGMPRPGVSAPMEEDVEFLADQGIVLLVSLTGEPTPAAVLEANDMDHLHIPIEDFTAPTIAQLDEFVAAASGVIAADGRVGVHCAAGLGRTGTFLAAYLVSTGMPAADAMKTIRAQRPGSIETPEQEAVVRQYADSR